MATVNPAPPPVPPPLLQHDMASFVEACPAGQYDLVFASFAVHHLRCALVFASLALMVLNLHLLRCTTSGARLGGPPDGCWLRCLQPSCPTCRSFPRCSRGVQLRLTAAHPACCSTPTSWAPCLAHCCSLEGKARFLRHNLHSHSQPTHWPHTVWPPPAAAAAWRARRASYDTPFPHSPPIALTR